MAKTVENWKKEAISGNVQAQLWLGNYYCDENNVDRDLAASFQWNFVAAREGCATAQLAIAEKYLSGEGVEPDLAKAEKWCRLAADQGLAAAEWRMIWIHFLQLLDQTDSDGSVSDEEWEKNRVDQMYWRKRAAEHGHPVAQYEMGRAYLEGDHVSRDAEKGVRLIMKAAENGCDEAYEDLYGSYACYLRKLHAAIV